MGIRYVIYRLNKPAKFTDNDYQKIFDLLHKYNEDNGEMPRDVRLNPYKRNKKVVFSFLLFYPNQDYFEFKDKNLAEMFEIISDKFKEYLSYGKKDVEIIRELEAIGMVETEINDYSVTTVLNDEILAHKVIGFVVELSTLFPDLEFELFDTFYYCLYTPVLVKNGKMKPNKKRIKKRLQEEMHPNEKRYLNRLLELDPDWDDPNKYIRPIDNYDAKIYETEPFFVSSKEGIEVLKEKLAEIEEKNKNAVRYYDDINYFPEI